MDLDACLKQVEDKATQEGIVSAVQTLHRTGFLDIVVNQIKQGVIGSWDRSQPLQTQRESLGERILFADQKIILLETFKHFSESKSGN